VKPADRQLVLDTLKRDSPPPDNLRNLERLGDEAFDFIASLLDAGELPAPQRRRALRRMSLLSRQQCHLRKGELLELALARMHDADESVRSAATHLAIVTTQILTKNPQWIRSPRFQPGANPSLADIVKSATRSALGLGLEPQVEKLAHQFLKCDEIDASNDDALIEAMGLKLAEKLEIGIGMMFPERRPRATSAILRAAEEKLGRELDPFLRRAYLEVADGGFGPGYGALPLIGDVSLFSIYESFRDGAWPADLLPVFSWGDAIWSCVDSAGRIVTHDDVDGPTLTAFDVRTWLRMWIDGIDLWTEIYDDVEAEITNPFTRQPIATKARGKVKGRPWTPPETEI